jgi:hypothetical protein
LHCALTKTFDKLNGCRWFITGGRACRVCLDSAKFKKLITHFLGLLMTLYRYALSFHLKCKQQGSLHVAYTISVYAEREMLFNSGISMMKHIECNLFYLVSPDNNR